MIGLEDRQALARDIDIAESKRPGSDNYAAIFKKAQQYETDLDVLGKRKT